MPRTSKPLSVVWAAVFALCAHAAAPRTQAAEAVPVSVAVVRAEGSTAYQLEREFVGQVEAARRSQVGFELPGRLAAVGVDEGDSVTAGAVIARLDIGRLEARRAELRAALAQTQADLSLASATLKRVEEAVDFNGVSLQEVDEAREQERALAATVRLAQARVATVEVDIEKSSIRAPYDAVVVRRLADEGQVLAAGQAVLELLETSAPEARVGVAGDAADAVATGQSVTVVHGDRTVDARVRTILPLRDPASRTVDVILDLSPASGLVPGDLIRMRLSRRQEAAGFWIPVGALTEGTRGLWSLYVAEPDAEADGRGSHRLERRVVQVLHTDDDRAFVTGTLAEGEWVVADGLQRVVPGQQVTIQTEILRTAQ
jgi:RND family efflux transporter MFP subunit